jgi:hypothetical protein
VSRKTVCKRIKSECSLFAATALCVAAIVPATAEAAVISPQPVKPSEVTAHVVPSAPTRSPAPTSPATPSAEQPPQTADDTADEADRPPTRPGAHRRRYVVPRTQQQELLEEARFAEQFANAITGQDLPQRPPPDLTLPTDLTPPDPTISETDVLEPSWTEVLEGVEEVVGRIFDWFCARSNHQRADGAVEDPHQTGACF